MELILSAPGVDIDDDDRARVSQWLEKIDRRLKDRRDVRATVRVTGHDTGKPTRKVTLEIDYGRTHLLATADAQDTGQAVRQARDEIIRQINDMKQRGSHSSYANRR